MNNEQLENETTIIRKPNRFRPTFVSVVFVLIAVYFLVQGILLIRHHSIKAYNIGTPASDSLTSTHEGIVLREEKLYTAPESGFATLFTISGEWVAKDQMVASIDANGGIQEKLRSLYYGHSTLSYASRLKIQNAIRKSVESYDPMDFNSALVAKGSIESTVINALLNDGGEELKTRLSGLSYTAVSAEESGFFLDWYDGYEGKAPEDLTEEDFLKKLRTVQETDTSERKNEGDFLYKLAPENKFTLAFLMSDGEVASLSGKKTLSVRMEDGSTIAGTFSITETKDGKKLGVVSFVKYGANYLSDRFVRFRIVDEEVSGFKIPESSIVKKSFYVVPRSFISEGSGTEAGVVVRANGALSFVPATVYAQGAGDNFVIGEDSAYVYAEELSAGQTIVSPGDTGETYTLSVMTTVEGCFQINSGYCIFKPILRIRNSIDTSFVVISANVRNGLKSYDRIVLDAEGLSEQEIIFE